MSKQEKTSVSALTLAIIAGTLLLSGYLFSKAPITIEENKAIAENTEPAAGTTAPSNGLDLDAALSIRAVGNPDAPIRIDEYFSLSCGHCKHFHVDTYKDLKKKYIDTGKVYFVFNDYPLNAPALMGAKISRCLPENRYEKFISLLFSTQDSWAFAPDYALKLEQNARLAGLNKETFEQCKSSKKLDLALSTRMQEANKKHQISSTPSFVINNTKVVSGGHTLSAFEKAFKEMGLEVETTE